MVSMSEHFNVEKFYAGLDQIFEQHRASIDALPYLEQALDRACQLNDSSAELSVISEFLGFDRSHARHDHSRLLCTRALQLRQEFGLADSAQSTIILINVATAYRQAGDFEQARRYYEMAAREAETTLSNTDRQKAALYNNFSILCSETGEYTEAIEHLTRALDLMQLSSKDPENDPDVATSLTNLGMLEVKTGMLSQALEHTKQALSIYERNSALQQSAHFTSVLAGYAYVLFAYGRLQESVHYYEQAVPLIAQFYGTSSDYYTDTAENLRIVREALGVDAAQPTPQHIAGLKLSRQYWKAYADELFSGDLAPLRARSAVGLIGHGSECYGFDDAISSDHDFGPRLCIWLTAEDYEQYGQQLQERYEALPSDFMGFKRSVQSPRGGGRDGVMSIDSFFESITGMASAPERSGEEHLWLSLDEATLAAATNGEIFADPCGAFSSRRQAFKNMPEDVRLYLISQRLGMIAQAGQYNYSRMLQRGDEAAAALSAHEFVMAVSSLIFLLNNPLTVGYAPYYKWRMAALRKLSRGMAIQLADICEPLELIAAQALDEKTQERMDYICSRIVEQLNTDGLSSSTEDFLEWHRPYVEELISSDSTLLHSM